MVLKAMARRLNSSGPSSGSGSGVWPRPTVSAERAMALSGRLMREAISQATAIASRLASRPQVSQWRAKLRAARSRGRTSQYSSSSASSRRKLTQKPGTPSTLAAMRVCRPRRWWISFCSSRKKRPSGMASMRSSGSAGNRRMPSRLENSANRPRRLSGAAANSEARIRLTAEAASCAVSRARGSASM